MLSDGRHVLHRDDVRHGALGEARKLIEQAPLAVLAIQLVPLGIGRKGLTRRATSQDRQLRVTEQPIEFIGRDLADVTLEESGTAIVCRVWEVAGGIEIDARDDGQPLQFEAMRQSTRTAE